LVSHLPGARDRDRGAVAERARRQHPACARPRPPMTDTPDTPVLEVRGLAVEFPLSSGRIRPVLDVSFALGTREKLGLVGESGCGKSLTALSLMRLLPSPGRIAAGSVVLGGRDLTTLSERQMARVRGGRIAMVYQDPMSSLNPVRSVGRQIVEAI